MSRSFSLEGMIEALSTFWMEHGCVRLPPCTLAVPTATHHPEVFFSLTRPAPWRSLCLQPVRRPLDGRHGEHPFRLGQHLQLQVVVQPPPRDLQELFVDSLAAAGLELGEHDLRFADWRWSAHSLAGSGTGWHVEVDGLGIARLTSLARLAERRLDPPAAELSYGIERLGMAISGGDNAWGLAWSADGKLDYGDLRRSDEAERSRFDFEVADVDAVRAELELLDGQARGALAAGLGRAAYELAVRGLEGLDVLAARGYLDPQGRAEGLARMREIVLASADQVAQKDGESDAEGS